MRYLPRPGTYIRRHENRAGDPLDGLINLFDLALVLAVGFLVAGFSAIGALDLLAPTNSQGQPLQGAPPNAGANQNGEGKPVGTVYQLEDGRYVFQPTTGASRGATSATGATGGATTTPTGAIGGSSLPPASGATQPQTQTPSLGTQ